MFARLITLLENNNANFRVMSHEAAGKSEEIAKIRGNDLKRSAKALTIDVKLKTGDLVHCIVVMPANCQLDSKQVTKFFKAKSVSMTADVFALTGCVSGSIPPFSLQENIQLLVDQRIADLSDGEIVFNAGELTRSIFLDVQDYLRITNPVIGCFAKEPSSMQTQASFFEARCSSAAAAVDCAESELSGPGKLN
jgi:Ala-tRNA(Pro) deacylase